MESLVIVVKILQCFCGYYGSLYMFDVDRTSFVQM